MKNFKTTIGNLYDTFQTICAVLLLLLPVILIPYLVLSGVYNFVSSPSQLELRINNLKMENDTLERRVDLIEQRLMVASPETQHVR